MARYRQARRMGRDEDFDLESELKDLKDDPESDVRDVLAAVVSSCDPDMLSELSSALREVVENIDRGGNLTQWSEDRRFVRDQRRRQAKDRRRLGRDDLEPRGSVPSSGIERFASQPEYRREEGEDRRRMAGDVRMALDGSPSGVIRLPRVERG